MGIVLAPFLYCRRGAVAPTVYTPGSGNWTGNPSNYTIGSGTLDQTANGTDSGVYETQAFTGDFTATITFAGTHTGDRQSQAGIFASSETGTFAASDRSTYYGTGSMTNAYSVASEDSGNFSIRESGTSVGTVSGGSDIVFKWVRVGGTITLYRNDVSQDTYSFSGDVVFFAGSYSASFDYSGIAITGFLA